MRRDQYRLVLAIHPTTYGFGWVVLDGPTSLVDWGLASATKKKNQVSMAKVERLLAQFRPNVLVLEEFEGGPSRRHLRLRSLARAIVSLATMRKVNVRVLTREQVQSHFKASRAVTRFQIALAIGGQFEELRHRLPPVRKPWMSENPRMGLFAAAGLAIAHFDRECS